MTPPSRRIAILGGGISGLAAAFRIRELEPAASISLFEASSRVGGVLQTVRRDAWLIERSADMFTTREPWALDLCRRVGLDNQLIETDARFRRAFVVRRGRLLPVPAGLTLMAPARIWPILTTPILSPLGKLRMGLEAMIPRRPQADDESLESFVVRRLGREAFERLIQPLIGGIYTADPSKLSMAATLPQFLEMERRFGSVVRGVRRKGAGDGRQGTGDRGQGIGDSGRETGDRGRGTGDRRQESGARYGQFLAPRQGMQQLVEAIAEKLPAGSIRLNSPIDSVVRDRNWLVNIRGAGAESFNDLIFATPATVTSRLLANIDPQLAALIGSIPHAGCSVAVLGVRREQVAHPLDGFGFVVPAIENRRILAGSMASVKFPGRAPDGKVLLRVFVGGALQPELGELPDADIRRIVLDELRELIGLAGEPEFLDIARWLGMMPQYHVGHLALVNEIERRAAAIPHLAIAGNAYRGVGIPFCIHSGEQAAERVLGRAATAAVA